MTEKHESHRKGVMQSVTVSNKLRKFRHSKRNSDKTDSSLFKKLGPHTSARHCECQLSKLTEVFRAAQISCRKLVFTLPWSKRSLFSVSLFTSTFVNPVTFRPVDLSLSLSLRLPLALHAFLSNPLLWLTDTASDTALSGHNGGPISLSGFLTCPR